MIDQLTLHASAAIVSFFAWAMAHELAHVAGWAMTVGVRSWRVYPWPHVHDGRLYFARTAVVLKQRPTADEMALAKLIPWLPRIAASVALAALPDIPCWALILIGGGVVDAAVGTLGISERSDLRAAATALEVSPWVLRLGGGAVVAIGAIGGLR